MDFILQIDNLLGRVYAIDRKHNDNDRPNPPTPPATYRSSFPGVCSGGDN